ncbi:MAG: high-potential iron-sulfur protein, partial [Bdellovibrionales bacterium]
MKNEQVSERRELLKKVFFYSSAGILANILLRNNSYAAELQVIDITGKVRTDADNAECLKIATGINYVPDLAVAIKDKKITKSDMKTPAGKEWKANQQTCANCALFNYKKETPEKPTCQLLPKCLVAAKGSCIA